MEIYSSMNQDKDFKSRSKKRKRKEGKRRDLIKTSEQFIEN